jgi:hypothetical protein
METFAPYNQIPIFKEQLCTVCPIRIFIFMLTRPKLTVHGHENSQELRPACTLQSVSLSIFIGKKNAEEKKLCTFLVYKLFLKVANKLTWRGVDSIAIAPGAAEHSCC